MPLLSVAGQTCGNKVFGDCQPPFHFWQYVVKAFSVLATIGTLVIPTFKDVLSEPRANRARVDENCFLDSGLHLNQSFTKF